MIDLTHYGERLWIWSREMQFGVSDNRRVREDVIQVPVGEPTWMSTDALKWLAILWRNANINNSVQLKEDFFKLQARTCNPERTEVNHKFVLMFGLKVRVLEPVKGSFTLTYCLEDVMVILNELSSDLDREND